MAGCGRKRPGESTASSTTGLSGSPDYNNRYTNNLWTRERGYITADAREQTAYGVARGYIAVGISTNNNGTEVPGSATFSSNRAFVQWAGFTAGQSVSFFDFYPAAAFLYRAGNLPQEDTGDGGWWVWGYTAQFGGGFSATLSAEERRMTQIIDFSGAAGALGGITTPGTNGTILADLLRAMPPVTAAGSRPTLSATCASTKPGAAPKSWAPCTRTMPLYYGAALRYQWSSRQSVGLGRGRRTQDQHAVHLAWRLLLRRGQLHPRRRQVSVEFAPGQPDGGQWAQREAYGVSSDCIFGGTVAAGNSTGCQLTTAWGIDVAYEHYWTPQWHQSLVYDAMMGEVRHGYRFGQRDAVRR